MAQICAKKDCMYHRCQALPQFKLTCQKLRRTFLPSAMLEQDVDITLKAGCM